MNTTMKNTANANSEAVKVLDRCRIGNIRVTVSYAGDDGVDWLEDFDTTGYVGVTGGTSPAMILLANSRSMGGGVISLNRVARIREARGGRELYRRSDYRQPALTIRRGSDADYPVEVVAAPGGVIRRFKSERASQAWASRLGVRVV